MYNLAIDQSQLVEARITGDPAASKRYNFTEIPNLSRLNIVLYALEVYSATQLAVSPGGRTVIAAADVDKIVITLKNIGNIQFMYQMPYFSLIRGNNGGFVAMIKPQIINLTDCYMQLTSPTGLAADEVAMINFYYKTLEDFRAEEAQYFMANHQKQIDARV